MIATCGAGKVFCRVVANRRLMIETRRHFTRALVGAGVALVALSVTPPVVAQKSTATPTPESPAPIVINNILPTPAPTPTPNTAPTFVWWKDIPWTVLASVGVIGAALIARNTSERKRVSDENIANDRLTNERELSEGRLTQDRDLAETRQTQERQHFRSKELQDQFGDIQNRLAATEPIIRANAALRLAQFGKTLKPGVKEGDPHTEENNPYFIDAVGQLATALYLEPNPAIRKAIREGFKNLIAFANTDGDDQPLLHALIERLADANRTARDNFVKAFAEWTVINKDWQEIEERRAWEEKQERYGSQDEDCGALQHKVLTFLTSVTPFCMKRDTTRSVLEDLLRWGEQSGESGLLERESLFVVQRQKHEQIREAQSDPLQKSKEDAMLLPSLDTSAQQLIDARDSLAEALRALKKPTDFPLDLEAKIERVKLSDVKTEDELVQNGVLIRDMFDRFNLGEGWKRPIALDISFCFLAGANLKEAIMPGAKANYCFMQGSYVPIIPGNHVEDRTEEVKKWFDKALTEERV